MLRSGVSRLPTLRIRWSGELGSAVAELHAERPFMYEVIGKVALAHVGNRLSRNRDIPAPLYLFNIPEVVR